MPASRDFPDVVSRSQLAEYLGCSVATIDRQAMPGRPLYFIRSRVGRLIRYPLAEALRALGLDDDGAEPRRRRRDPRRAQAAADRAMATINRAARGE